MRNKAYALMLACYISSPVFSAGTDDLSKAKAQVSFVYKRLAGVPASAKDLDTWGAGLVAAPDKKAYLLDVVAKAAVENDKFYSVTVLDFAQIESSEERDLSDSPDVLTDLTATIVGLIRDDKDYRAILSDDVLYIPTGATYAPGNNTAYANLYNNVKNGAPLASALTASTQSANTGLPIQAGIFTLRGFGSVFYNDGTNRSPVRFTAMNYLCRDMEDLADVTRPDIHVRRDVDRAPGGDSTKYKTQCVGCHASMDPISKAFAYLNFLPPANANAQAPILYTAPNPAIPGSGVAEKMNRNNDAFPGGAIVADDRWQNFWLAGTHSNLGWDANKASGNGPKSLGDALASTQMFSECMVKRVYQTVCLKDGKSPTDKSAISKLAQEFAKDYNMKELFKDTAVSCGSNIGL